jgi:hypothetical protein
VVNHPAVTSAIIGPRTMEQLDSQLPAAGATLDAAVAPARLAPPLMSIVIVGAGSDLGAAVARRFGTGFQIRLGIA